MTGHPRISVHVIPGFCNPGITFCHPRIKVHVILGFVALSTDLLLVFIYYVNPGHTWLLFNPWITCALPPLSSQKNMEISVIPGWQSLSRDDMIPELAVTDHGTMISLGKLDWGAKKFASTVWPVRICEHSMSHAVFDASNCWTHSFFCVQWHWG